MTDSVKPATTRIATCYRSTPVGDGRLVEIRRDNTTSRVNAQGRYVVTEIHGGAAIDSKRARTEVEAFERASMLGFTDVVRVVEVE